MANITFTISIHAPLAGRDPYNDVYFTTIYNISIHAPLAGRDCDIWQNRRGNINFNPRAPCGARLEHKQAEQQAQQQFQSTRPLRGATLDAEVEKNRKFEISIHAPLAGRDAQVVGGDGAKAISIHAPLAGRDP